MKTKLAILFALGLTTWGMVCSAQTAGKDADKTSSAAAAVNPAEGEIVPLITFDDTPLTDVIKTLARQAGINFQFDPKVTSGDVGPDGRPLPPKTISIRFENVTSQSALDAVLENHGLQYVPNPKTKIGRITVKDPKALEPLVIRVIQLRYSNPTNLVTLIKTTISARGQVQADGRSSQIVVQATEKEMEDVTKLVDQLDSPTQQVLIEARIMETSKNPSSVKGIDWTGTLQQQNFSFGNGVATGTTTTTQPGASTSTTTTLPGGRVVTTTGAPTSTDSTTISTLLGNAGITANTLGGFSPGVAFLNADGVRGVLSFLNSDNDTEVVATPRTVTMDNQLARLAVTRGFPIFTTSPGSANTPATTQITYTNVGTILEVTPRISGDSNVFLRVVPEVSNIDSKDTQIINGQQNQANVYATRRIETQVLIPSGNTLVMGGLISDNVTTGTTKVPLLGDIPGLGLLFRHESKTRNKSNLIVFITPTIVRDYDFHYTPTDYLRNTVIDQNRPKVWVSSDDTPVPPSESSEAKKSTPASKPPGPDTK